MRISYFMSGPYRIEPKLLMTPRLAGQESGHAPDRDSSQPTRFGRGQIAPYRGPSHLVFASNEGAAPMTTTSDHAYPKYEREHTLQDMNALIVQFDAAFAYVNAHSLEPTFTGAGLDMLVSAGASLDRARAYIRYARKTMQQDGDPREELAFLVFKVRRCAESLDFAIRDLEKLSKLKQNTGEQMSEPYRSAYANALQVRPIVVKLIDLANTLGVE